MAGLPSVDHVHRVPARSVLVSAIEVVHMIEAGGDGCLDESSQ
jgi:hypothetical protein